MDNNIFSSVISLDYYDCTVFFMQVSEFTNTVTLNFFVSDLSPFYNDIVPFKEMNHALCQRL